MRENPFFPLLGVGAVSHRETPPTRVHTCLPDGVGGCVCMCVAVCLYSNIPYGSIDTPCQRNSLNRTTGNERGDELLVTIAAPYKETLV